MQGIYCILNKINGKRYVGKSKNIQSRYKSHLYMLKNTTESKDLNRHLKNAVLKYGIENFELIVLEELPDATQGELADAEIKWMDFYRTCERDFGYNLRRDSSTLTEVHEETRKLLAIRNSGKNNPNYGNRWSDELKEHMSKVKRQQIKDGLYDWMQSQEWRDKLSRDATERWKDEDKKKKMAEKVAINKSQYRFEQYDKHTFELVGSYENLNEIMKKYPDFHKIAIYSVCNGWKKSYRGFIWKSILKTEQEPVVDNQEQPMLESEATED